MKLHDRSKFGGLFATVGFVFVFMFILAGCGSGDNSGEASSLPPSSAPDSASAPSSSETDGGSGTRTVKDAYGDVEVPVNPQRVVVLASAGLDNVLALGGKPVGAPYSISVNANFFAHLAGQTDGIENTGTTDQPSLEAIAKLNPDLIIGQKDTHEAVYEDLKTIAPVYMTDRLPGEWKELLGDQADAVNKQAEADKLIADFEARIAKFKADMGDKLTAQTISLIRPREDHIRIYSEKTYAGAIVLEAGLIRPAAQQGIEEQHIKVTEEQIADLDADVIISFGRETEADYFNDKIKTNPLWSTLAAVKNDRVHMVNWEVWLSGQGIQAANLVMDDLNSFFNN